MSAVSDVHNRRCDKEINKAVVSCIICF